MMQQKFNKAIFWDNDGVLVDSEELYYEACRLTLANIGVHLDRDLFIERSLNQGQSVISWALDHKISPEEHKALQHKRNEIYTHLIRGKMKPREGIVDCLSSLKGLVAMGIVTACLKEHFEAIHETTGLLSYFDFILTRDSFKLSKPHPEPYLKALEKVNLPKENCLVVEDSKRGLAAAKAAGLTCYVVPSTLTVNGTFQGADKLLKNGEELKSALLKWKGNKSS